MALRVMRAITAMGMVPSTVAGSARCSRADVNAPGSCPRQEASALSMSMKPLTGSMSNSMPTRPDTGVHCSPTEKNMIRISPHQNTGMLLPTVARPITSWSNQLPRLKAAAMPSSKPPVSASNSAAMASSMVAGNSTANSAATGSRVTRLCPRSPCSRPPT